MKNYYKLDYLPSTFFSHSFYSWNGSFIIKQSQQHVCPPSNDTIQINIESATVDVLNQCYIENPLQLIQTEKANGAFRSNENKAKISRSFSGMERNLLSSVYRHTQFKFREFQYKLLNNIVFTNDKLFRFNIIDSLLRVFCQTEVESPEHLLFHQNLL